MHIGNGDQKKGEPGDVTSVSGMKADQADKLISLVKALLFPDESIILSSIGTASMDIAAIVDRRFEEEMNT